MRYIILSNGEVISPAILIEELITHSSNPQGLKRDDVTNTQQAGIPSTLGLDGHALSYSRMHESYRLRIRKASFKSCFIWLPPSVGK